jgi:hypothetical protein
LTCTTLTPETASEAVPLNDNAAVLLKTALFAGEVSVTEGAAPSYVKVTTRTE